MNDFSPSSWSLVSEELSEFLSADESHALDVIKELADPKKDSAFWEGIVCRILSGTPTDHKCPWDVEIADIRVEVKFATSFFCKFNNGIRNVFKFVALTGTGAQRKPCDVLVLIGFDDPEIYCWVIPFALVTSSEATITVPSARLGRLWRRSQASFDKYGSCMSQMLPDVLKASDIERWNAAKTRRSKSPQTDIEDFL